MMCATGAGTPMWRSPQARMVGPSLSRKNRLSAVSARKNASDDSALIPVATPPRSAWKIDVAELLVSDVALAALPELIPRSCSQPWIVLWADCRWPLRSLVWLAMPPTMRTTSPTARATRLSIRSPAAAARGSRPRDSHRTTGDATAATTPAVITGITIVSVSDSSQTAPTSSSVTPTRSHDVMPRSRSQPGAARTIARSVALMPRARSLPRCPQGSRGTAAPSSYRSGDPPSSVPHAGLRALPVERVQAALAIEGLARRRDVLAELVHQGPAERELHERAHDRLVLGVGREGVGGHHPAALCRELRGDVELVVVALADELERDERELLRVAADHLEVAVAGDLLRKRPRVGLHR